MCYSGSRAVRLFDILLLPFQQLLLFLPHLVEVISSPDLSSAEDDVQNRCDDLECQCPTIPRPAPEVHDKNGLEYGTCKGYDASCEKDFAKEVVITWVHSVQDDSDMRPKFSDYVEQSYWFVSKLNEIPNSHEGQSYPRHNTE
jgi:hypothetical protein